MTYKLHQFHPPWQRGPESRRCSGVLCKHFALSTTKCIPERKLAFKIELIMDMALKKIHREKLDRNLMGVSLPYNKFKCEGKL